MGIQTQVPWGQSLVLALSDPHSPCISLGNQTGQNLNTICDQMNHPNSKISSWVTILPPWFVEMREALLRLTGLRHESLLLIASWKNGACISAQTVCFQASIQWPHSGEPPFPTLLKSPTWVPISNQSLSSEFYSQDCSNSGKRLKVGFRIKTCASH